jgi:hypothetical protein
MSGFSAPGNRITTSASAVRELPETSRKAAVSQKFQAAMQPACRPKGLKD